MSLTFDGSPAILRPTDTTAPVDGFPETVLVTFQHQAAEALLRLCPEAEVVSTLGDSFVSPIYRFLWRGETLGLFLSTVGGPAAAAMAEEVWGDQLPLSAALGLRGDPHRLPAGGVL